MPEEMLKEETLKKVPGDDVKIKAEDAVRDGAVKFEAIRDDNGTWTVKTTFET